MSVVLVSKNAEASEGPRQITRENVIFWSKHSRLLQGDQRKKAQLLLEHDCVQYIGYDETTGKKTFIVLPLNKEQFWHETVNGKDHVFIKKPFSHDYNKSAYRIYENDEGVFTCNCQAWHTKSRKGEINPDGTNCSHVLSLFFSFRVGKFGKAREPNEVV